MKTVLVTNGNLSSLLALGGFLREYGGNVSAVFITTHLPSQKNNVIGILKMLKTSGVSYTYFKLLTNLILPKKLRLTGLPVSVVQYMKSLGYDVPVFYTSDINDPKEVKRLATFKPDILLSFSSTVRFSDELIEIPSRAAINAHYALLPGYAGLSPYFWYLRNKEVECGVTLHQITSMLDAGPIIEQERFSLDGANSVLKVLLSQAEMISPLLVRYYKGETSEADAYPQDLSLRSYFRHPNKSDIEVFNESGNTFFTKEDISQVVENLKNLTC